MGVLEGIKVIDVGVLVQAPQAATMLGDMGADVLKVELPGFGDQSRWLPVGGGIPESPYFEACNRGKRSLTLDLRKPRGREVFLDLIRTTDVLISNFKPGTLDRLGLGAKRKTQFHELSTGQQRRLALALAVAHEPRVVFLDEPTAGLDVQTRAELHALMRELKAAGTTIMLATHDMAEAEEMADRVAILLGGRIVAAGTPIQLTATGAGLTKVSIHTAEGRLLAGDHPFPAVAQRATKGEYAIYYSTDIGRTVGARHHLVWSESPLVHEPAMDLGRFQMFLARWRGDAHQFQKLIPARLGGRVGALVLDERRDLRIGGDLLRGRNHRRRNRCWRAAPRRGRSVLRRADDDRGQKNGCRRDQRAWIVRTCHRVSDWVLNA